MINDLLFEPSEETDECQPETIVSDLLTKWSFGRTWDGHIVDRKGDALVLIPAECDRTDPSRVVLQAEGFDVTGEWTVFDDQALEPLLNFIRGLGIGSVVDDAVTRQLIVPSSMLDAVSAWAILALTLSGS
jgi:hypothetical protein